MLPRLVTLIGMTTLLLGLLAFTACDNRDVTFTVLEVKNAGCQYTGCTADWVVVTTNHDVYDANVDHEWLYFQPGHTYQVSIGDCKEGQSNVGCFIEGKPKEVRS